MATQITARTNETTTNGAAAHARPERPAWTQRAHRLDRPHVDAWYKPESGALDGVLLWHGDQEDSRAGGTYHVFVIREARTDLHFAVRERAGLRGLRLARLGSRVYIEPRGKKDIGDGRSMWEFDIVAEHVADARSATGGSDDAGGDDISF
jgi:hypothetical protein